MFGYFSPFFFCYFFEYPFRPLLFFSGGFCVVYPEPEPLRFYFFSLLLVCFGTSTFLMLSSELLREETELFLTGDVFSSFLGWFIFSPGSLTGELQRSDEMELSELESSLMSFPLLVCDFYSTSSFFSFWLDYAFETISFWTFSFSFSTFIF